MRLHMKQWKSKSCIQTLTCVNLGILLSNFYRLRATTIFNASISFYFITLQSKPDHMFPFYLSVKQRPKILFWIDIQDVNGTCQYHLAYSKFTIIWFTRTAPIIYTFLIICLSTSLQYSFLQMFSFVLVPKNPIIEHNRLFLICKD